MRIIWRHEILWWCISVVYEGSLIGFCNHNDCDEKLTLCSKLSADSEYSPSPKIIFLIQQSLFETTITNDEFSENIT